MGQVAARQYSMLLLVATLVGGSLAACSRSGSGQSSPTVEAASTSAILSMASQRLAATQTIAFGLDIQGETYIDDARQIRLLDARGQLVRPDRVRTDFKIAIAGTTIGLSLIIIGNQRWSTDLITGKWGPAPEEFAYDPSILFDNQNGIGPVMDRVQSAVRLPDESVRGHDCYHIRAVVDPSIIDRLTAGTLTGSPVTVDLWIDRTTADLVRAKLSALPGTPPAAATVWTLDLSGQGSNITIAPPA